MNKRIVARDGLVATDRAAACANWLQAPTTKVSNVNFGFRVMEGSETESPAFQPPGYGCRQMASRHESHTRSPEREIHFADRRTRCPPNTPAESNPALLCREQTPAIVPFRLHRTLSLDNQLSKASVRFCPACFDRSQMFILQSQSAQLLHTVFHSLWKR